jgi:medium-chain acyl-[acyl-carrier-protein] hydrolase
MRSRNLGRWLVRWGDSGPADVSLICFHHAGAGPSVYRHWADLLPDRVAVCAVHLPGRGTRFREPLLANIYDMAEAVATEITEHIEPPFAFFGHSMGAVLAFETAGLLQVAGAPGPRLLIASGRAAPHLTSRERRVADLPRAELAAELSRWGATPRQVLSDPDLLDAVLPIIRADLGAIEAYRYAPGEPLDCSVAALGGADDPTVNEDELRGWQQHTRAGFSLRVFPGCHFFYQEHEKHVVAEIAAILRQPSATAVLASRHPAGRLAAGTGPTATGAWVLYPGPAPDDGAAPVRGTLRREHFPLRWP